jgi:hypothetical protein
VSAIRFGFLASAWTATAWGILQLRNIRFDHALCLPGRCGPPLGALLSIQLFWLLGTVTIVVAMLYFLPNWPLRRIGVGVTMVALIGMAIVIGVDYARWHPAVHLADSPTFASFGYQFRRFVFPIVTMVDVPWLQTAIGGLLLAGGSKLTTRQSSGTASPSESSEETTSLATRG